MRIPTWIPDEHALTETLQSAFEHAGIGMALVSPDGRWLMVNDAICTLTGYNREELLQIDFQTITHADDLHRDLGLVRQLLAGDISRFDMEKRYIRKDGQVVWGLLTVSLVRYPNGEPRYFISQIQDISRRRELEMSLMDSNQRLSDALRELQRSNEQLEQFAYVASHDLQEPLRMVSSYVQLLNDECRDTLDDDAREFIGFALDGTRRMHALIQDILRFSRVQSDPYELKSIDLGQLMMAIRADLASSITESKAQITADALPTISADIPLLRQLLQNLVSNAIKFQLPDVPPAVHIGAEEMAEGWTISVADNGIGIAPQHHHRVFQVFKRAVRRDQYPGTGIGLALCQRVVERHGGRIWVESELGQGATFYFTIPGKA